MKKKSTFLLFEMLIALSLMGMLVSLLFSFLIQSLRLEKKMEAARTLILERQNLQIRLQDICMSVISKKNCGIYTQQFPQEDFLSLIVTFDNGIDPNPSFSGIVLGRIYLDPKKNLCFVYWPIESMKNRPWRKEILASDVSDVSFQFLGKNKKNTAPHLHAGWHTSWEKNQKDIPSILRVILKQKEKPLTFAFQLPCLDQIPTYPSSEKAR